MSRMYAWRRIDEHPGHSLARVERTTSGWRVDGAEVLTGPSTMSCRFSVVLDEGWVTREVDVDAFDGAGAHRVSARADAGRRWSIDGERAPHLDGATDVDVAATPLTNTFPIRRLNTLARGEESTLEVAWVDVPSLTISRVAQTYRRLDDVDGLAAWEYRDDAHGAFRLTVDADGIVVVYEGFAERLPR